MYNYFQAPVQAQIIKVTGENGARAFAMAPNSSAILLDENEPLIWVVTTDGAGYKSITPYKIELYVPDPPPDYNALMARIAKLEEALHESNHSANQ